MTSPMCAQPGWGLPLRVGTRPSTPRRKTTTSKAASPSDGDGDAGDSPDFEFPFCSTPEETVRMIEQQVAHGSDYIKILIEDGTVVGYPGLPVVSDEVLATAVKEAHRHNRLIVAHATKADAARRAVSGRRRRPRTPVRRWFPPRYRVRDRRAADTFVIPTLTVVSSALGHAGAGFAADPRVTAKLPPAWLESLRGSMNVYPQGRLEDALGTVAALQGSRSGPPCRDRHHGAHARLRWHGARRERAPRASVARRPRG